MRRALLLAGGGARGAYQVGMLRHLVIEKELDFDVIRGVSVGALNGAVLAQASTGAGSIENLKSQVRALETLWSEDIEGNNSIYKKRLGGVAGFVVGADSLFKTGPLRRVINKHVSVEALKNSGRDFAVGTVSLVTGESRTFKPPDPRFLDKLLASASIPVVFPHVDLEDEEDVLVDGGVRDITPVARGVAPDIDELWILLTSKMIRQGPDLPTSTVPENDYQDWHDNFLGTKVSGLDVLERTVEILTDEIYLDDIRGVLRWNRVLKSFEKLSDDLGSLSLSPEASASLQNLRENLGTKRYVELFVIAPREFYGDDNGATEFDPRLIRSAIDHGHCVAKDKNCWVWPPTGTDDPCACDPE